MEIRPILSSLRRNPVAATLIAAQIALTAILANVLFIVNERIEAMSLASGVDEPNVFLFHNQNIGQVRPDEQATDQDLATARHPRRGGSDPHLQHSDGPQRLEHQRGARLRTGPTALIARRPCTWATSSSSMRWAPGSSRAGCSSRARSKPFTQGDQPNPRGAGEQGRLKAVSGESAIGKMINITGDRGEPQQRIIGVTDHPPPWPALA